MTKPHRRDSGYERAAEPALVGSMELSWYPAHGVELETRCRPERNGGIETSCDAPVRDNSKNEHGAHTFLAVERI